MAEEKSKTIEIVHPIRHDGVDYSRGQIELPEGLANLFLGFRDPVSGGPIARVPKPVETPKATATPVTSDKSKADADAEAKPKADAEAKAKAKGK